MGGFFSALGDAALGAAEQQFGVGDDMQAGTRNQGNLLTNIVGRYLRSKQQNARTAPGANVPARSNYDPNVPGIVGAHEGDPSSPQDPNYYEEAGMQGPQQPDQSGGQIPNQNQWQSSPSAPAWAGIAAGLAQGSTLVTQPTIAKIGEKGPEMVVPLNARAGNRVQPDVLEGHIQAPKVPGVRYNRYKAFTDRAL